MRNQAKPKFIVMLIVFVTFSTLLSSCKINCSQSVNQRGIKASKERVKTERELNHFHQLIINLPCDIDIRQITSKNKQPYVILEGPKNYIDLTAIETNNGKAKLYVKKSCSFKSSNKFHVTIYINRPEKFLFKGVGDITMYPMELGNINLHNSGVGDLTIKHLRALNLKMKNTGVGDATLSGNISNATIYNTGVGDMNMHQLKIDFLFISNSGVGNVKCTAQKEIKIFNKGVGDVNFSGTAHITEMHNSGTGKVDINR